MARVFDVIEYPNEMEDEIEQERRAGAFDDEDQGF